MGYKCEVCKTPVPAGRPRLVHTIYRPNREIAREIPVCQKCKEAIDGGMPLANLLTLVKCESRWVQVKPKEPERLVVGRSAPDKEIARLQAQIAQLEGGK